MCRNREPSRVPRSIHPSGKCFKSAKRPSLIGFLSPPGCLGYLFIHAAFAECSFSTSNFESVVIGSTLQGWDGIFRGMKSVTLAVESYSRDPQTTFSENSFFPIYTLAEVNSTFRRHAADELDNKSRSTGAFPPHLEALSCFTYTFLN